MPMGQAFPGRTTVPGTRRCQALFTGAGAANTTKPATSAGRGIVSCNRTGAGRYTVTFQDVGGYIVEAHCMVHTAAAVAPLLGKMVANSLNRAAKTVLVEFWDLAVPALADPPAGSVVDLNFAFADNVV